MSAFGKTINAHPSVLVLEAEYERMEEVVEKILELRSTYQIGALRIALYLERYYGIKISESTVTRVLRAHGMNRLPKTAPRRAIHSKRYAKTVPGHHVQVDVKFLHLKND